MTISQKNLVTFLFGLGSLTQIRIIGAMGVTELICVIVAPFVLRVQWPVLRKTQMRPMLLLAAGWFLSALVTDFWWRDTYWMPAIKGCAAILFLAAGMICAYGLLRDDLARLRWYALGAFVSSVASMFVMRSQALIAYADAMNATVEDLTDFKSTYVIILIFGLRALAAFFAHERPTLVVLATFGLAVVSLINGSRSVFLMYGLCVVLVHAGYRNVRLFRTLQRHTMLLAIALIIAGVSISASYQFAVEKGWLGEDEYTKYIVQSESNLGIISGRSNILGAMFAVADSPLFGHGSWALDPSGKYGMRMLEVVGDDEGIQRLQNRRSESYIPCHSHVMQAWVWHGFAGGLFWIATLVWMVRYLRQGVLLHQPTAGYNMLVCVPSIWHLFFSGFSNRVGWAVLFATIAITMAEVARRRAWGEVVHRPWNGRPFNSRQSVAEHLGAGRS